jgi:hypothetical protein
MEVVHPSQNSATSAPENLNTGHYYSQTWYVRDESKIRQHAITTANDAEGNRDVATAIPEPVQITPIEPTHPYHPVPVENTRPHYSTPAELTYPFYSLPLEYGNSYYSVPTVPHFTAPYTTYDDPLYPYYGLPTPGYYEYLHENPYISSLVYQTGDIATEPFLKPGIELQQSEDCCLLGCSTV